MVEGLLLAWADARVMVASKSTQLAVLAAYNVQMPIAEEVRKTMRTRPRIERMIRTNLLQKEMSRLAQLIY